MRDNLEQSGYPTGGSLRISGTVLHTSAEFQAVLARTGDHQVMVRGAHSTAPAHSACRGLWE
jgi:hypothetical protein